MACVAHVANMVSSALHFFYLVIILAVCILEAIYSLICIWNPCECTMCETD